MTNATQPSPSEARRRATLTAREQWNKAPAHVRLMASAYVEPLLACLEGIGAELDALVVDLESMAQALPQGGADGR